MNSERGTALQEFLDTLKIAFSASIGKEPEVSNFLTRLFAELKKPDLSGAGVSAYLPVCNHLPTAFQLARSASPELSALAFALEKIAPSLVWKVRSSGGLNASENWPEGHANAMIVGQGGLEERSDIAIGASLLAPHVRYPDHTHAPEEIYLVLTPGRFQHGDSDWFEPGPGGTLHNEPNIKHAMASDEEPLLAIWCLMLQEQNKV